MPKAAPGAVLVAARRHRARRGQMQRDTRGVASEPFQRQRFLAARDPRAVLGTLSRMGGSPGPVPAGTRRNWDPSAGRAIRRAGAIEGASGRSMPQAWAIYHARAREGFEDGRRGGVALTE